MVEIEMVVVILVRLSLVTMAVTRLKVQVRAVVACGVRMVGGEGWCGGWRRIVRRCRWRRCSISIGCGSGRSPLRSASLLQSGPVVAPLEGLQQPLAVS